MDKPIKKMNTKRDSKMTRVPSNPQIVEDTKPESCTQLSCRTLRTQLGQNHVLQNFKLKSVI